MPKARAKNPSALGRAVLKGLAEMRDHMRGKIVYTTLEQLDDLCRRLAMTVAPGR